MANLLSTNVSGRLYASGYVDTNVNGAAFRFYDGTTFRGGLGLDDWAHSGSAADITMYVAGAGTFYITTNSVKRHWFNGAEVAFRTYAPDLNYKTSFIGGDQLNTYYGAGSSTLYVQYHNGVGGNFNVGNGKLTVDTNGVVVASGSLRAPIFYDSNDTTYYLDPNSSTSGYFAGTLRQNVGKYVRDSHYRTVSGYGDYYSAGSEGWTRVAEIRLTGNCTGAVIFGTLYDHRYSDSDAYQISIAARADCDFTSNNESHYINVGCTIIGSTGISNYRDKVRVLLIESSPGSRKYEVQFYETGWNHNTWQLETTGWTILSSAEAPSASVGGERVNYMSNQNADNVRANSAVYAPTYYDSNDTGFYLNPNGESVLNQISAGTSARWGRSGNFWTVRPNLNSGVGYWTGTNGWGTSEGTWANAWKGGFSGWDIWGTATDHPQGSGYVHAQGIVSGIHYTNSNGSSAYGWMMVGAADATANRYWLRGKWDTTTSAWVEMITTGNIASQSVSYADESGYSASSGSVEWTSVQNKPATFPPSSHNHDDRYYTETESDARFVLNDFAAQTAATSEDEKSGTWNESSNDSSWGDYKPGNDSTAGYSWNDAPGYVQYNIPSGYTTAYIGQLRWDTGGYFDVHAVMSDGSLVFRGRFLSKNTIENTSHSGNHDGQQIIKVSGLDGMRALRITNQSGRLHLQGIGWSKEVDTDGTQTSETHWDLIYNKPSSFTPSSHTHSISDVTGLQTALDGKLSTTGTAANSSQLQGYSAYALISEARGAHSGSDFPSGTLVRTDIDANGWAGDSFIMEVSGKSYGSGTPFKLIMEGYLYADTIINVSAMSYGSYFPAPVKVMRLDGNLAFWWPRGSYWNSFEVHVRSANGDSWNRVTSISDSGDPASGDKKISITPTQVIHTGNIGSQSVSYATSAGSASSVAWSNVSGKPSTFPPDSHNHDDRYYTETEINNITHQWEWRWIRRQGYVAPAGGSAQQWTDYYLYYFTERTNNTEINHPEQGSGYINTITNVGSDGGFGGSTYGNIFGDLDSYHCLIYTNIFVEKEFRVNVSNFNGDDPHAIFIDGVFVHGNTGCCVDTSYIYTFKPGWHRIDLIYSEGGGGDFIRMGWNPKDYTANIKDMTPHRAGENPRNILDKFKNLVIQSDQSVRAPIFYDSQDTGYYIDPNSESKLRKLWINNGGASGVGWSTGLNMGDGTNYWNLIQDAGTARQRNYGTGGYDWYNNTASSQIMYLSNAGDLNVSSSMRAPIFYDSNDTNYCVDPNSYSQLSGVLANNWFRPQGNTGVYFQTYGRGIWAADSAGAQYGNVSIYGEGINSWPGYAINNLAMFMARDIRRGIFIPSADAWLIRYEQSINEAVVDFQLSWGSDIRYKSNVNTIGSALEKVTSLRGVTYNYKTSEKTSIGFIAQEVEQVVPEVVSTDIEGYKSVSYANMVALLTEAIKEQQTIINDLKARIELLESK